MRRCSICGESLELYHGNTISCKRCGHDIDGKYVPPMVYITVEQFQKLKSDSEELKKIRDYANFLERTD